MMRITLATCVVSAAALATAAVIAQSHRVPDPIPVDGFEQLLPRGAIAALVDPTFVSAAKADIPDDAWVLGFAHQGQAFAYDLNLLNAHEVVNHMAGGAAIAAVW